MRQVIFNSAYFGILASIAGYTLGTFLKRKFRLAIFNPLLVSVLFVMLLLIMLRMDFESYNLSARYLSFLLTPATVCLAIPLYRQLDLLKKNMAAATAGILAGVLSSLGSILALCLLFRLDHRMYVTLLPKSITTAIGIGVSEELGGIPSITVAVIILTGIVGNIASGFILRLFRIRHPIAVGLALGTSSHVIGTSRALELGEVQAAMSSLSVAVAGLLTVIGGSVFAGFY